MRPIENFKNVMNELALHPTVSLCEMSNDAVITSKVKSSFVDSPDIFERFLAAVAWAEESRARVHLALVARAEMIHPQKFGVLVAANLGLVSNIFTTEVEARAWLDAWDGQ